jgi:hypothetical protein
MLTLDVTDTLSSFSHGRFGIGKVIQYNSSAFLDFLFEKKDAM